MEVGATVIVDGKEVKVVGRHAAGKHVSWLLEDGRSVLDLHLMKNVEVKGEKPAKSKFNMPLVKPKGDNPFGEDLHD